MAHHATTLDGDTLPGRSALRRGFDVLALTIVWCPHQPSRVGEVFLLPAHRAPFGIGRGDQPCETATRLLPVRQRPGAHQQTGPLEDPHLSRHQLTIEVTDTPALKVTRVGRRRMAHQGIEVDSARMVPGDTLQLGNCLLLLCEGRPWQIDDVSAPLHPFGHPDPFGIVGETPAAWALRRKMWSLGRQDAHTLIQGESGTGKELVARGLHAVSHRAPQKLVSRNAATIPSTLIDAELFGNVKDYPNAGMPARPGLVGEAHRSTLYFDEIGELPDTLQSHLLRVLDAQGEYQRLGESRTRRSDLRFVGSTNRPDDALRADFLARMPVRIDVPPLGDRQADVPLIAQHLLSVMAERDPSLEKFYDDANRAFRMSPVLVRLLVQHEWTTHVRELESLLRVSIAESPEEALDVTPGVLARTRSETPEPTAPPDPSELPPEVIQAALDRHEGVQERVWRELGLSSRHVLARLIKKHGLRVGND